jgi:hypothetical protein
MGMSNNVAPPVSFIHSINLTIIDASSPTLKLKLKIFMEHPDFHGLKDCSNLQTNNILYSLGLIFFLESRKDSTSNRCGYMDNT